MPVPLRLCSGEVLVVTGSNLGPVASPISLSYAPAAGISLSTDASVMWPYTTAPCSWVSTTQINCISVAGVGSGFSFQLTVGGQSGPLFSASAVGYAPPAISGLAYEPCDTRGGGPFNISGQYVSYKVTRAH